MADRFLQIMVQLAERNSYQSLRAFRELSFYTPLLKVLGESC